MLSNLIETIETAQMSEKIILVEDTDVRILNGVNNKNIDFIKDHFPKVKLITRGNSYKIIGTKKDTDYFSDKFECIIDYIKKNNTIDQNQMINIFNNKKNVDNKEVILHAKNGRKIYARTLNQLKIVKEIELNDIVFSNGPAGTGKTYTAVAIAVNFLKNKKVKKIILTRPAIEAGENIGYLPGDIKNKLDPYMQPLYDSLSDMLSSIKLNEYMENGTIQISPLGFMRGRTLENAFVILDEAQNTTINQMKMFLTRMGVNSKLIITGDETQIDLKKGIVSGFSHSIKTLNNIKGIGFVNLDDNDVVRHKLVKKIINAYNK